jgi:DNA-directed RNA polymerase specialized sigma subunit
MRVDDVVARDLRRQRIFRDRSSPLHCYDDTDIIARYRLDRRSIMEIIDALEISLGRPTRRSESLSTTLQIFAALRFLASGTQQRVIGDTIGISKSSVCRY